jgi:hypothetical protein
LVHGELEHFNDFNGEILKVGVVELKLTLESTIRHTAAALEHGQRLVENLLKGHRQPSSPDGAYSRRRGNGKGRSGVCIPHMVDRKKQEVLERAAEQ